MEAQIKILRMAAAGKLPERIDGNSELPVEVVRELIEGDLLRAIDVSSTDGRAYMEPRITFHGREVLRSYDGQKTHAGTASADAELSLAEALAIVREKMEVDRADSRFQSFVRRLLQGERAGYIGRISAHATYASGEELFDHVAVISGLTSEGIDYLESNRSRGDTIPENKIAVGSVPVVATEGNAPSLPGYENLEKIGHGGYGTVYKANQIALDRAVAIKILRSDAADSKAIDRFLQEVRVLATLQHGNIVRIVDSGSVGRTTFLVTEYLPGGTLRDRMKGAVDPATVVKLLRPVITALKYSHDRGIVHRDVKPENILFNDAGEAVLVDFGIARDLGVSQGITSEGISLGPVGYMSPEQHRGEAVDSGTDIYALGVIIYEMLTGTPLFKGTNHQVAAAHLNTTPPELPPPLRAWSPIVSQLLEKDRERRPQSVEAVLTRMEGIVHAGDRRASSETRCTYVGGPPYVASVGYAHFRSVAINGSISDWRRLGREALAPLTLRNKWRDEAEVDQRSFERSRFRELYIGYLDLHAAAICHALAGLESGEPARSRPVTLVQEFLHPDSWSRGGVPRFICAPDGAVFVFQALHGCAALSHGRPEQLLNLAMHNFREPGTTAGSKMYLETKWSGWPECLDDHATENWKFLKQLFIHWGWLAEAIGSQNHYVEGLAAHYMYLSVLELLEAMSRGQANALVDGKLRLEVPPLWTIESDEAQRRAANLVLENAEPLARLTMPLRSAFVAATPHWVALTGGWNTKEFGFGVRPNKQFLRVLQELVR